MFKGFYNLTSGVLTHQRNLDVVAHNIVNISTPGFKQERYTATTFDEVMYSRVGNLNGEGEEIGNQTYIRATSNIYTDFRQGILEPTGLALDFGILGEGFFCIQQANGERFYTRCGGFTLDNEGYMSFSGMGRVLDTEGRPILLESDKIASDSQGVLRYRDTGEEITKIGVYTFDDYDALDRNDLGYFIGEGARLTQPEEIVHEHLERSNTDSVKQMTDMITYQRSLQSASQIMKMYDKLMNQATSEVGRL